MCRRRASIVIEVRFQEDPRFKDTLLSVILKYFCLRVIDTCSIDGCLKQTKNWNYNGGRCLRHRRCGMLGCRAFCELAAPEPFSPAKEYCPDHYDLGLWAYRAEDNMGKSKSRKSMRFYSELQRDTAKPEASAVVVPRAKTPALHPTTCSPGVDAKPSPRAATPTPRAATPSPHPMAPKPRTAAVPPVKLQSPAPRTAIPTSRPRTPGMKAPTPALRPVTPHLRASVPTICQNDLQHPEVCHTTPAPRCAEHIKCRVFACAGRANETGKNYGQDPRTCYLAGLCAKHEVEHVEATLRGEAHNPPPELRKLAFQEPLKDEHKVDMRPTPSRPVTPAATTPSRPSLSRGHTLKSPNRRSSSAGVREELFALTPDDQSSSPLQPQQESTPLPSPQDFTSMAPNQCRRGRSLAGNYNRYGREHCKCAEPFCMEPNVANATLYYSHACSEHGCVQRREAGFAWCRFHAWERLRMCWACD